MASHPKALSRLPACAVLAFSPYLSLNSFLMLSRNAKGTCLPYLRGTAFSGERTLLSQHERVIEA